MSKVASDFIQLHIAYLDNNISEIPSFLSLQRNSKTKLYPNIWQVITGTIEVNETAIQTAIRELNEETGLVPIKMWALPYLAKFYERYTDTVQFSPTFLVLVDNTNVTISHEHIDYKWLDYDDIIKFLTLPSHKEGTKLSFEYLKDLNELQHFEINLNKYLK